MSFLTDIALFGLLFFLLVFIHELGHFLMARWVGIRVERFSIGMGPSVLAWKKGDTEYKLGLLPLGGYVKMAGDDPSKEYTEEEKRVGFLTQKPPAKLLVVFGGPVFNLLLPIFLFAIMLAVGIPTLDPVIGTVEPGMAADKAGLISGDRLVSVDGKPLKKWQDLESIIEKSPKTELHIAIERTNMETGKTEAKTLSVTPELTDSKSKFGEPVQVGRVGVSPDYVIPQIFFEDPNSPIAKAGFKNFDRITKVNDVPVKSLDQATKAFAAIKPVRSKGAGFVFPNGMRGPDTFCEVTLVVDRDGKQIKEYTQYSLNQKTCTPESLGLLPITLILGKVDANSPAGKAGLQVNDRLISIGGKKLSSWEDVPKIVNASDGKPLEVVWSRANENAAPTTMKAMIAAEKTVIDDPLLGKDNPLARDAIYRIGVGAGARSETSLSIERSLNPITMVKRGLSETWNMISMTATAMAKLITGKLSLKLLGSPIMIYKVAGNSYRIAGGGYFGWISFFSNLAMLSIALGLMNLLPIPVLDGGHAVFFSIEWIRGRPVSLRAMEIATHIGLVMIICLFALVLFNDFHRYGWIDSIVKIFQ